MCWTKFNSIGPSLKNLCPSQKTFRLACCPKLVAGLMSPDKIVYLTKKSNNILQLQMRISFKMKHIYFELHNILFNASYVSLAFEKHNSIET